jgi:hypothetical protein
MGLQYSEWRSKPANECTFDNLVQFFTQKYNLWLETGTPAAQHGFRMNAEGTAASGEAEQSYADSLIEFSNVNEHNANTIQNLSATNSQFLNNVIPAIQQLSQ